MQTDMEAEEYPKHVAPQGSYLCNIHLREDVAGCSHSRSEHQANMFGVECSGPFLGVFDHTRSVPAFRKAVLKITPSSRRSRTFCVVSQLEAWRFTFGAVYDLAHCRSFHGDPIQQTPKMLDPSLHLHESFP